MKTDHVIPVFFTIDDSYAPYLGIALKSIIANASKEYKYRAIIIHQELNNGNKEKLSALADENFEIEFYQMKEEIEDIKDRPENRLRCDYFTMTIYYRLFIPDLFPQYDKAIYLDSDIVVPGDISELYETELGDNLIGACMDKSVSDVPELAQYIRDAVGVDSDLYINSGILLMNMKKLREKRLAENFLSLLNTYHFDCLAPDQDYFNAMCYEQIEFLDEAWDAMPNNRKEPLMNPKLIHYNLFEKPWCYDDIQYTDYFWEYAKQSDYYAEILKHKKNYSEAQKQSDSDSMNAMLVKGGVVPTQDVTFRKMYERGAQIRL